MLDLTPLQRLDASTPAPIDAPMPSTAAAPATQGSPVLDARALAELAQLDPTGANQLMARVLTTYRSSLARLLAQLVAARQPFDGAALKLATHTLKSSSASVGASRLSVLCGLAEIAVRDGLIDGLPAILDDLVVEAARVDAAVHQLLLPHQ